MTWSAAFEEPIELPNGLTFRTLRDAGTYILKLPKADQNAKEWQAAMEALILVAENNGPTILAWISVMRALHRNEVRVFGPCRKVTLGKAGAEAGRMIGNRVQRVGS